MPRLILDRQLELLHATSGGAGARPGLRPGTLLEVAGTPSQGTPAVHPQASEAPWMQTFLLATDATERPVQEHRALIVAAVCDQDAGITDAVASLRDWLTDTERFPEAWIAAVARTVQSAQSARP